MFLLQNKQAYVFVETSINKKQFFLEILEHIQLHSTLQESSLNHLKKFQFDF